MSSTFAIPLPYEVLRKSDGQVALSVNTGHLPVSPEFKLFSRDLFVGDYAFEQLPGDVVEALSSSEGVLLFEVSSSGVENIHEVRA